MIFAPVVLVFEKMDILGCPCEAGQGFENIDKLNVRAQ
jgi:hypothetical protein